MQWFRSVVNKDGSTDANEFLKICSFFMACALSGACCHLIYKGSIKGDNAMYLMIGLVITFMSASGLVVVGDKFQGTFGKLSEEKTKREGKPKDKKPTAEKVEEKKPS